VDTCGEVFVMNDENMAEVKGDTVPAEAEDAARTAAGECPVEAIVLED
jgi:ferredoxin